MAEVELRQVGPYSITRLLAEGSTSRFYLGKHQQRKKDVVIKVLHIPLVTPEAKSAFLTRAELLKKKLTHRNIAQVLDFGLLQEQAYLVLQYVPGGTMRQRFLPGQRQPVDEVKRVLTPLADALQDAHVKNILHGNLHPGNLLIDGRNDILLTDYSLLLQNVVESFQGETAATPYRAPEHLCGALTAASDQYSLAVMVYEWLCGRRPYEATDRATLLHQQEHTPLPSPRSLNELISLAVENVLLKALALDPHARFQHMQAFSGAYLRALMGLPLQAISETKPSEIAQPAQSTRPAQTAQPIRLTQSALTPTIQIPAPIPSHPIVLPPPDDDDSKKGKQFTPRSFATPLDNQDVADWDAMEQRTHAVPLSSADEYNETEDTFIEPIEEEAPATLQNGNSRLNTMVTADLRQGGILSRRLPGYEERSAQIEMAALVARALTEETPAIVEAATGTGKGLAYLIPIVRSGKVALISTANKALQEQLFYKDIPFVQRHIGRFDAALVKGMGNYVCLNHLESEHVGTQYYVKNRDFLRLLNITEDPDSKFNGDFETLDFQLSADIRSKVMADSDHCAWHKCSYFSDCYVRKMRQKATHAKVIVVNHTLLLLDAALEGALLPEHDVIVIDEAHHLEEEATRAFTVTISQMQISNLLAQPMLKEYTAPKLLDDAKEATAKAWEQLARVADPGFKSRANLQAPLEEGLLLASAIAKIADELRTGRPKPFQEKESEESVLYEKLLVRTENLSKNVRTVFSVGQPGQYVYYVERATTSGRRGLQQLEVSAAPLDVTSWLQEKLFKKCNVILTSATLATLGPNPAKPEEKGPNFAYFRRRIGLDSADYAHILERILPLTFDYEQNALLYLPRHLPEPVYGPNAVDYTKAIAKEIYRLVEASQGRAFLLFSSKRMLEEVYTAIAPELHYPLLRQGDMARIELMRQFRETEGAVLFGLKSFWEGVDIAGEALSLVVIDKLPFDPPDDPVHEARVAQMKANGENWFGIYVLPQAVLRLKQGLGRLLRTREDRGVMAILDTRLYTKGYGKLVVNALPPARRTTSIQDVEQFFAPF